MLDEMVRITLYLGVVVYQQPLPDSFGKWFVADSRNQASINRACELHSILRAQRKQQVEWQAQRAAAGGVFPPFEGPRQTQLTLAGAFSRVDRGRGWNAGAAAARGAAVRIPSYSTRGQFLTNNDMMGKVLELLGPQDLNAFNLAHSMMMEALEQPKQAGQLGWLRTRPHPHQWGALDFMVTQERQSGTGRAAHPAFHCAYRNLSGRFGIFVNLMYVKRCLPYCLG